MDYLKEINELNIGINRKEDDIKNLINEQDIIIKELKNKLDTQENQIKIINNKLEKIINIFINEFKEKDIEINSVENNVLIQEASINNYIDENIEKTKNYFIEQKNMLLKDLNEDLNYKIEEIKKEKKK